MKSSVASSIDQNMSLSWSQQRLLMSQEKQLLILELNEVKERYSHLKRQGDIFMEARMSGCDNCHCSGNCGQRMEDATKQVAILTDYISLKENMFKEGIEKLERRVRGKDEELREVGEYLERVEAELAQRGEQVEELEREKYVLEEKLRKCLSAFKESEDYYMDEITVLKQEYEKKLRASVYSIDTPSRPTTGESRALQLKLKPRSRETSTVLKPNCSSPSGKQNDLQPICSYRLKISKNKQKTWQSQFGKDITVNYTAIVQNQKVEPLQSQRKESRQNIDVNILRKRSISPLNTTVNKSKK